MSIELTYLILSSILAASLWIPFIVGVNLHPVSGNPFERPPDLSALPAWVHRSHRAHLNLIEGLVPFGIVVLVAHSLGVSTIVTVWAAAAFFWLRVLHAIGMITGMAQLPLRPIIFTGSYLCTMAIAVMVLFTAT